MNLSEVELQFDEILEDISSSLDIPPSKYKQAVDRYLAVGNHLEQGNYPGVTGLPDIYPQGSFRLGTIVRPLKDGEESDYDIDLVCQMPMAKEDTAPKSLKLMVGTRLKEDANYKRMIDEEGRRCWTLEYAEEDGIGFHMDILPSIPADDKSMRLLNERNINSRYYKYAIDLTEKDKITKTYSWKDGGSNPEGYAKWFDDIKTCYPDYMGISFKQKKLIFESIVDKNNKPIFASIDDVPEPLVRTPLQRAIQILKRHRDFHFKENPDNKPISMIITTLAALAYENELKLYSTLLCIIRKLTDYKQLSEVYRETSGLIQKVDGQWWIPNPVNPDENFADRWDNEKADTFFQWLRKVKQDFDSVLKQKGGFLEISKILGPVLGQKVINNAFEKNAKRKRAAIDSRIIRTSAKTGILSEAGVISSPRHNFHC